VQKSNRPKIAAQRQFGTPTVQCTAIHLESAAIVFHMDSYDLENHQVIASRVF
jgi:hypothetical protein